MNRSARNATATIDALSFPVHGVLYVGVESQYIDTLSRHGLQTERLPQTIPQRRFTGSDEKQWAMAEVRKHGFDPAGKEADGYRIGLVEWPPGGPPQFDEA